MVLFSHDRPLKPMDLPIAHEQGMQRAL